MKVMVILVVALLITGFAGFVIAEGEETSNADAEQVDAVSASQIGSGIKIVPSGNAPRKKSIPIVSSGVAKAVSPASVAKLTPGISVIRIEEATKAVTSGVGVSSGKLKVGFATSQAGIGQAVKVGETVAIEMAVISQEYSESDGTDEVTLAEGTLVFAKEVYAVELIRISADSKKIYSVAKEGIEVGEMSVIEADGVLTGNLEIEGEDYEFSVNVEEEIVNPSSVLEEAKEAKENIVSKVISWFKGLFG